MRQYFVVNRHICRVAKRQGDREEVFSDVTSATGGQNVIGAVAREARLLEAGSLDVSKD